MPKSFAVRTMRHLHVNAIPESERRFAADDLACFEVYRTEQVSVTSTLFSGGDWRWRLRSAAGAILAHGDGYRSESACQKAVTELRNFAGSARNERVGLSADPGASKRH